MPHVEPVTWANWFGGKYGDGKKFFAQFAIEPESTSAMYPECEMPEDQKAGIPQGAVGGADR